MSVLEQLRLTVVAVRRPALRLVLLGYFGYCLARKASRVALVVYAFNVGGVRTASVVAAAQLIPAVIAPPVGSLFGDRMSSESALTLGYLLQAVALVGTGVSMAQSWPLLVTVLLSAAAAAAFTLTRPVYLAALPDLVEHPDELALGNAASTWVDGLASVAGPVVAGTGLLLAGAGPVMVLLGATCLVAALASSRLRTDRPTPASASRVRGALLAGVRAVTHDRELRSAAGITMAMYAVVGLLDVLLVVVVVDLLGLDSARTGGLTAAIGVGAVVGGVTATALAGRSRLGPAVVAGALCVGFPVLVLGLSSRFWVSAALLVAMGAGKSVVTAALQTLLQRTVDDGVAVRVFGVQESLVQAGTAVGAALGPLLVAVLGLPGALVATGVVLPAVTLLGWRSLGASMPVPWCPGRSSRCCAQFRSWRCCRSVPSSAWRAAPPPRWSGRARWWCARARPQTGSTSSRAEVSWSVGPASPCAGWEPVSGSVRSHCCATSLARQRSRRSARRSSSVWSETSSSAPCRARNVPTALRPRRSRTTSMPTGCATPTMEAAPGSGEPAQHWGSAGVLRQFPCRKGMLSAELLGAQPFRSCVVARQQPATGSGPYGSGPVGSPPPGGRTPRPTVPGPHVRPGAVRTP